MCDLGVAFNTVVFNGLIDSQARAGAMDEVSKLVESMELHECKPDSITYSTIVKGYCIKGDVVKAFEVFRTMQASGMTFDAVIYNTVMDGCCRHNRMDLVDSVLEDMEKFNVRPSNFTLGILMKMYGRRRQLDKAFRAIEDLPRKFGLQVNSQVRTCLMSACLSNGDVPRALQVFEQIRTMSNGVEVNAYGSLICGLVRLGRVQEAVDFVDEAYGIGSCAGKPRGLSEGHSLENETLEQLLRALSQRHLMDSVGYELLERLRRAHVSSGGRFFSRLQK
jgi:pentatricopeptide repeat protein